MKLYRVANWSEHFENNRTRELKSMQWVPLPNKHDGDGYTELLDHKDGAAHFGAWVAIVQVASRCDIRGTLSRDNARPHDAASLSRMTRIPRPILEAAIERLVDIGWITVTTLHDDTCEIPQDDAVLEPQGGAALTEGNGRVRKGREGKASKPRPGDPIWDAVMSLFHPSGLPPSQRARIGAIVRDLKELGATPDEIKRRYDVAYCNWDGVGFSPEALVKNWDQLTRKRVESKNGRGEVEETQEQFESRVRGYLENFDAAK